ncbi:MAG: ATP-binding protein [Eggerthellaceae bacterium]
MCANAVENAAAACADQPAGERRRIAVRIASEPRLALEVENTCCGTVPLNSEGLPEPQRPGHGAGVRSIAAFAERHGAHLTCEAAEGCSACACPAEHPLIGCVSCHRNPFVPKNGFYLRTSVNFA